MRKSLTIILFLLVSVVAQAQTSIGIFDHFANSAASESPDGVINPGAVLLGDYRMGGLVAKNAEKAIVKICTGALEKSGFDCSQSDVMFRDLAACGIVCGDKTIPGTWKEEPGKSVRMSFNKIFTYGMTGNIVPVRNGYELYFPASAFIGFIQRTLAIIGRSDTVSTVDELERLCGDETQIGFRIIKK